MGQAVIDLPDPLDAPMPAPAVGADDLISQLAGAEIDRLLAEADAAHAPPAKPAAIPPPAPIPAGTAPAAVPLGKQINREKSRPDEFSAQITELLDGLGTANPATAPVASLPPRAAPVAALVGTAPPVAEAPRLSAAEEIAAELDAQAAIAERAAVVPAKAAAPASEDDARPSLLLRALEWINKPLLSQPDAVREMVGKVAIITLLNAFAVLLYLLLFRRH